MSKNSEGRAGGGAVEEGGAAKDGRKEVGTYGQRAIGPLATRANLQNLVLLNVGDKLSHGASAFVHLLHQLLLGRPRQQAVVNAQHPRQLVIIARLLLQHVEINVGRSSLELCATVNLFLEDCPKEAPPFHLFRLIVVQREADALLVADDTVQSREAKRHNQIHALLIGGHRLSSDRCRSTVVRPSSSVLSPTVVVSQSFRRRLLTVVI
eukprot:3364773-Pyramimonas_sp.AAC.2